MGEINISSMCHIFMFSRGIRGHSLLIGYFPLGLFRTNINNYNPPINFRTISLATLRHVLDSYHAITPVRFDICPPPLISTEKSKVCRKKARTSVSIFIFLYMEEKRHFFVESSDSDIRKLVGMLFQKS